MVHTNAGQGIGNSLVNAAFALLDAPSPSDSRQWYSVVRINAAKRAKRVEQARAGFDRVVGQEIRKAGFSDRLDRVALFGFSQGANMSLDAVAIGRWPIGAVVAASGQLVAPPGSKAAVTTPVLLLHGEQDDEVPAKETTEACHVLKQAGFIVEARIYPGLGHSISPEAVQAAGEFLAAKMAR